MSPQSPAITDIDSFNHLCWLSGITESYYDIRGQHHVADFEAKCSLLAAMNITVESDSDVYAQLEKVNARDWQSPVPEVLVYQISDNPQPITLTLGDDQTGQMIAWQLIEENGNLHQGEWHFEPHQAIDERELNGKQLQRFEAFLPYVLATGYHTFTIKFKNGKTAETAIIATPETCYQPVELEAGSKVWGIGLQLYSLRSRRNWGIGDLTDLRTLIDLLAPMGVDVIGLNPLHTLFSHLPENASPYSPSSRDFLNPIYLDIERVDEFSRCEEARDLVFSDDFHAKLQSLRKADLVQYSDVWSLKLTVLKMLYQQFRKDISNGALEKATEFRQYQDKKGAALADFALFEALQAHFYEQDSSIKYWPLWPQEFQKPGSQSVVEWAQSNAEAIQFHQYLQWRTEQQLSAANRQCKSQGMCIGIYNDLAVGNEPFSSSCWADQVQYALDVGIGAPPDDFSLLGQNWGLPPQIPHQLKALQYRLFIRTLRANMRHAGALRIDHVMSLMRLYWVPENYSPDRGTYIAYPFEDLLGILVLESQRNHCLIIGEDLGTVPDEVRHHLWLKKILSYRILFFEKNWDQGSFKLPHEYPALALCTSGSHDLPTLTGYWCSADLKLREQLNLFPSDEIKHRQWEARGKDRAEIKSALHKEQLISEEVLHDDAATISKDLFLSIQRFLARSRSRLMMVQLEDILLQSDQMNVPGTIDEYPNWRHKMSIALEDLLEKTDIKNFAGAINLERKQSE
jgi:(1->4)-alpha-D-glucan 1-alpha-D-glucosylmutase